MRSLGLARSGEQLSVLCLGAHSDDIEIGAGGTIINLIANGVRLDVHWCVLSAAGQRATEAQASAEAFLRGAEYYQIDLGDFEDSYFPDQSRAIKKWLIEIRSRVRPDLVLTHARNDAHQDHREINQLTWNLFRDHLVLEYEIPKWDGDLGRPNVYVPLTAKVMDRKISLLHEHFGTQRSKDWFDRATFEGLARLRGMECRAPEFYAEAFFMRKARLI
ncbi:PIG-L deacetylase family protein [Pseudaminobacter soli (ex Li et al. 2025)]|uniref:PIG-L domain-containing protein n=1 Tax=Pseudaminobacter soli (ex Li et al. 2025) TaxID=1295366 RepID=A0A2P7S7U2_9HYPH|nr:PIG-L deacetylase family protein [Mesorhizobium soli]PSJ58552.1 PIG-L domain-containing protein [Mesorhizobium soli]